MWKLQASSLLLLPLAAALLLGSVMVSDAEDRLRQPVARPQVIAYVFPQGRKIMQHEIDPKRVTRVNYAFANIVRGQVVEGDAVDAANLAVLQLLKQGNPSLEVVISVGGWLWSGQFSNVAASPAGRTRFVESAVAFLRRYQMDGVDLDWEYPGMVGAGNRFRAADGANLTLLLREMRTRFSFEEKTLHRHLLLSIAAAGSEEYLAHTELAKEQESLDTINLMAYDYYEPGDGSRTGNHAPLYTDPLDPKSVSADASVRAMEAAGVRPEKIVLGVPFYGHIWGKVPATNHGLFQPGSSEAGVDAGYQAIATTMLNHGFTRYWDNSAKAPFLYSDATRQFVSYEDPESLALKCAYVHDRGLAGVMFWEYFNDPGGSLLETIHQSLQQDFAGHGR